MKKLLKKAKEILRIKKEILAHSHLFDEIEQASRDLRNSKEDIQYYETLLSFESRRILDLRQDLNTVYLQ